MDVSVDIFASVLGFIRGIFGEYPSDCDRRSERQIQEQALAMAFGIAASEQTEQLIPSTTFPYPDGGDS